MITWQNISKPHLTGTVEDMDAFKAMQKLNGGGLKVVSKTSNEVNAIVQDAIDKTSSGTSTETEQRPNDETETV